MITIDPSGELVEDTPNEQHSKPALIETTQSRMPSMADLQSEFSNVTSRAFTHMEIPVRAVACLNTLVDLVDDPRQAVTIVRNLGTYGHGLRYSEIVSPADRGGDCKRLGVLLKDMSEFCEAAGVTTTDNFSRSWFNPQDPQAESAFRQRVGDTVLGCMASLDYQIAAHLRKPGANAELVAGSIANRFLGLEGWKEEERDRKRA